MRTLFKADWLNACFIHFAVDPAVLQPHVPLPLDLLDGQAIVSLVAFTQKRLRPAIGGRIAERLSAPLADHEFLNLRTYVRANGEPAIFFLAEWIPNRLARLIGPALYGLPYRLGKLDYQINTDGQCVGTAAAENCRFAFAGQTREGPVEDPDQARFLLERYVAYTHRHGRTRRFQIAHESWKASGLKIESLDRELIEHAAPWFREARLINAHFSAGVTDVKIAPPTVVNCAAATDASNTWL